MQSQAHFSARQWYLALSVAGLSGLGAGCGTAESVVESEPPDAQTHLGVVAKQCPLIESLSASPLETSVGNSIELSATPSDPAESSALSFVWYARAGTFQNSTLRKTTYVCQQVGAESIFLVVGNGACGDLAEIPITCDDGTAQ
ncbi:MAG TPA: hypothetical protein VHW01_05035 [Polyangiaceae bacterium]|jgi:hypothetical protein|nr:hypothetical protein [Polyangiaceae bacterium]